jgi:hypothetical protein
VALLVVLVLIGAGTFFVWQRYLKPMAGSLTELSQVADIEKQVKNVAPFAAPASDELTEDMVTRFVKVQETIEARLGSRMADLRAKYELLDKAVKSEGRQASFGEAMGAFKDLSAIIVEAKRAQVDALNQAGYSVKEYEWVRQQVYAAVGVVAAGFDVKNIQRMAREASGPERTEPQAPESIPERNKELVTPYEKKLREWAPLACFGL